MSFPHNGVIFKPDLPPIDEEELSDSSMDTEDEDMEDGYVIETFSNDIQRDIEVCIIHFMLWYIFQRLLKNTSIKCDILIVIRLGRRFILI